MPLLTFWFESEETSPDVRRFSVHEGMSSLFSASVWARKDAATMAAERGGAAQRELSSLRRVAAATIFAASSAFAWVGCGPTAPDPQNVSDDCDEIKYYPVTEVLHETKEIRDAC